DGPAGAGLAGAGPAAAAMGSGPAWVDAPRLYARVKALAQAQSADVAARLAAEGVKVIKGRGRLTGRAGDHAVVVGDQEIGADVVLIATRGRPRGPPAAPPRAAR